MNRFTLSITCSALFFSAQFIPVQGQTLISVFGGSAHTSVPQPDGKVLLGGSFTMANLVPRNGLARAYSNGSLDRLFDPNVVGMVSCIALQTDGKIVIGGWLTSVGGVPRNRVARLNADGTLDSLFNPNLDREVNSVALQTDGKILLGGGFTTVGGVARKYLVRLQANGALDTGFNPAEPNNTVRNIVLQNDGKVLLGGEFTQVGGITRNNVARLNADGTLDDSFNPNANGIVNCMLLQTDGKIVIGGMFTNVGGELHNQLARLNSDGTLDNGFSPNLSGTVVSIVSQADGKLVIGSYYSIVRLNTDGTSDVSFNPILSSSVIYGLALQADGKILKCGDSGVARLLNTTLATQTLTVTGGPSQIDWVRGGSAPQVEQVKFETWNGSAWVAQGIAMRVTNGWRAVGLSLPANSWVRARGISAGGFFNGSSAIIEQIATYGAGNFPDIAVRETAGVSLVDNSRIVDFGNQNWLSASPAKSFTISNDGSAALTGLAIAVDGPNSGDFSVSSLGSTTLAGGSSTTFTVIFTPKSGGDHTAFIHIASNDVDEAPFDIPLSGIGIHQDTTFPSSVNSTVYTSVAQPNGKVLLAGSFTMVKGVARNYLARLNADGTLDTSFNPSVGSIVHSIALQEDGKVLLAGSFKMVNGVARNYLARLNADGTLDTSFNANANGAVERIAMQADGKVLLAGTFTTVGGISRNRVARVNADGTLDVNFSPGPNGVVSSICVQTDGKLLLGGDFTTMNAVNRRRVARLNSNGTLDASFGDPNVNSSVRLLALSSDGKVMVGGPFTTVRGVSRNWLARLNSDGSLDTEFDPKMNNSVSSVALQSDGKVLLGGSFTLADVIGRNYVARLNADGSLDNSFNPNPNRSVFGLALQTDGKVLLGGEFYLVGGVGSGSLVRLPNNNVATQSLIVTGTSQIEWMRGNSAPEVEQVRFERWDGGTWVSLGIPTRQAGGWRVTGLALPTNSLVRAKGRAIGGYFNGSSTVVEQVLGQLLPEIVIEQPAGSELIDGTTSKDFGTEFVGSSGTPVSFTVRNIGPASLSGLALSKDGAHNGDFILGTLATTTLPPGESMTFTVAFLPTALGSRSATLHLASNDSDENPFDLTLIGTGTTSADIAVESPSGTDLTDSAAILDFGALNTGVTIGKSVIIRNTGTSNLTNLALSIIGTNASEYTASALSSTSLAQNGSMSFALTFAPVGNGTRSATLRIASIDTDENPFDITLTGEGHVPQGPGFTLQPQSVLTLLGSPATFAPTVTGDPVITYRWNKAGKVIPGAVNPSFTIPVTKAADVAAYNVFADNPVGAEVPSNICYLGLVTLSQGTQILKKGAALSLKCTVAAPVAPGVSLSYSWRRSGNVLSNGTQLNGAIIAGADKAALSITKIGTEDAGNYTCLVTLNTPGNDPFITNGDTVVQVVDAVPVLDPIPLPAIVSVSQPIDALITASNFPTGFSLVGLPAGMTFDTKTGRIKGKPTTPSLKNKTTGLYIPNKLTFKATNPFNVGPALDFYLTIEALDPTFVGTFNGVVSRESYSNFGMGGYVQVTVASTGVVSGFATLAGQKHSVVGSLNISVGNDPTAELLIKRTPASLGNLELTMNIIRGNNLMQGRITDPEFEVVSGNQDLGGPDTPGFANGSIGDARFNGPRGIALHPNGDGFLADTGNHLIRKVADDSVTTFAGTVNVAGESNGTGTAASFESPEGLALDTLGNLYVADTGNAMIRKITALGVVTTFAGTADQIGNTNATGAAARFNQPSALCFDPAGNLYVVDRGNHTIRKITPAGVVTTLAGKADTAGHKDGGGIAALFNTPRGIVYEPVAKALFVTDSGNNVIRKVTLKGAVTTHAGSPGVEGYADGLLANARFIEPMGIATVGNGILIVGDKVLRQINPNGVVGAVSDYADINGLDQPVALAFNEADEVLIAVHETLNGVTIHQPSGTGVEAMFDARRNPWTATSNVAQMGSYTAGIETGAAPGDLSPPQGDGYATLAISKTGVATWAGKAADGTGLTFGTIMAADRHIPLHVMMYKNTGSLQGQCFINATTLDLVSDVIPAFDWYKIPQPLAVIDRSYKGGFLVHPLELSGGKYTPNNIYTFLGLTGAPANLTMDFSEAGLTSFTVPFTIATPNTVTVPTNSSTAKLKIDPKTGIYTGSFKSGSPAVTSSFTGVIIDYEAGNAKCGYGHFLLPESLSLTSPMTSGRVRLEK